MYRRYSQANGNGASLTQMKRSRLKDLLILVLAGLLIASLVIGIPALQRGNTDHQGRDQQSGQHQDQQVLQAAPFHLGQGGAVPVRLGITSVHRKNPPFQEYITTFRHFRKEKRRSSPTGVSFFCLSALLLLVLGILANHHHTAFALDDLALFTDRLHRRTNLHCRSLLVRISFCCAR